MGTAPLKKATDGIKSSICGLLLKKIADPDTVIQEYLDTKLEGKA